MSGRQQHVVIVGGGYVSLHAYRSLRAKAGDRVRITVVSADDCHNFHGFTGEVVAGLLPLDVTRTPLTQVFSRAQFVHGRVLSVDTERKSIRVQPESGEQTRIDYDHLIVGTGGREPVDTVPGLAEFGHTLRGVGDLGRLLSHLGVLLTRSASSTVLVAGGGLAGVELAAAVADRARAAGAPIQVVLAQSGPALLPALAGEQPVLVKRAARELARLGVQVRLNARLAAVTASEAHFADGSALPVDLVLGTMGQRAVALPGLQDLPRDEAGRLVTQPSLRVTDSVWAAGDAAAVKHPKTGIPVPANALWAIKAGAHVGRSIARTVRGRRAKAFGYRGLGQAASFGMGRSVGEVYGIPLTGVTAWLMRLAFFLRFMPQRSRAVRVVGLFARLPFGGRVKATGRSVSAELMAA